MNERIAALKAYIQDLNDQGVRRTKLYGFISDSLRQTEGEPTQIRRAKAFAHLLDTMDQLVLPHELIAGTMLGLVPLYEHPLTKEQQVAKAIETIDAYLARKQENPEANKALEFEDGHAVSFEEDFTSKKSRWSLMSRVHKDALVSYNDLQDLMKEMAERYVDAGIEYYEVGRELERAFKIQYPEQEKAPYDALPWFIGNHLNLDYGRMIGEGLAATRTKVEGLLAQTQDPDKVEYYQAALITVDAVERFIKRYAQTVRDAAKVPGLAVERCAELERMAEVLDNISEKPSNSFYEAVQFTWMLHIIANIQGGSALSFGRLDQYLAPYYERDLAQGAITPEFAHDLLSCLWLKVNEPAMRTVQSVTVGGVDRAGSDAANEVTRLCLRVAADVAMPYPNLGLRVNDTNPKWVYAEAVHTVESGCGQPMILNDDVWIASLERLGYSLEDARDYYNMGCVEIMVAGKQPSWGVLDAVAFPVLIEDVLRKGRAGDVSLTTFDEFKAAYFAEMDAAIEADYQEALTKKRNLKGQCYDNYSSLLIDGCIENGCDMLQGGSDLPTHWSVYGYGIGTASDSLYQVKKRVYDTHELTLEQLDEALCDNFEHYGALRQELADDAVAYGNDEAAVDNIADEVLSHFDEAVLALNGRSAEMGADKFVSTLFGYFFHIYHGEIAEATPDGRRRGESFSDSMGPSQGKDVNGPTRLLNSVLHLDCSGVTGGYALNFKINPSFLKDDKGRASLAALLETYVAQGGPQVQCYTTKLEDMQDAQIHPEKHRDLIVRVGGYCEFFVNLDRSLQNEIMTRTTYGE